MCDDKLSAVVLRLRDAEMANHIVTQTEKILYSDCDYIFPKLILTLQLLLTL